mmetsp:Transcript_1624/g.4577  ORF Transcript_1624/g.4577 Transcript_1624/m.4577 type:complete len:271 (+) Transcript_1624:64-876(+)
MLSVTSTLALGAVMSPHPSSTLSLSAVKVPTATRATRVAMSDKDELKAIEFVLPTGAGLDGSMVGDYGFDPLGLASIDLNLGSAGDKERSKAYVLRDYREAELRHGRLAMLAALAWPVQELLSPSLSRALREPMLVAETGGRSPSVLNGGLEQTPVLATVGIFAALIAAVDIYSLKLKDERGENWLPGDFGFDPLNILGGAPLAAKRDMQEKELNNGRLAMVAVTIFVIEEAIFKAPVVQLTPAFFTPLYAYPAVQEFFNGAFSVASFRT